MSYAETQEATKNLLLSHAGSRFPVPVVEIANKLGVTVVSDPNYPSDRSGHIHVDDAGNSTIVVNEKHSPERKRFTIAHEIAHSYFDGDYLKLHKVIDRNGNAADASYRERERRANDFAANLLMPEEQFIQQWIALGGLEKVTDYFFVSKEAAHYRAINLGLLSA